MKMKKECRMKRPIFGMASALLGCITIFLMSASASGQTEAARPHGPAADLLVYERQGWIRVADGEGRRHERRVRGTLPGVSPDGGFIAFFRKEAEPSAGEAFDLWMHDRRSGAEHRLDASLRPASAPVWSGDGLWIAFLVRDAAGHSGVRVLHSDGSRKKTIFSEGDGGSGFFCSLSFTPNGDLLVHDMRTVFWLSVKGKVREAVPLARIMGASAEMVRGNDRLAVCPTDPTVMVFSHPTPGTRRFEKIMREPSTVLSLHDRWLGTGKNMRITPREITAFDPVWSRDGKRLYFVGYKDTRAADADLFRIYRMDRFGTGLKDLGPGEHVSVGMVSGAR